MPDRPRLAPVGGMRKNRSPPAAALDCSPTAPVSQNNMDLFDAAAAAGSEITLP